jgi:hypothetical protein
MNVKLAVEIRAENWQICELLSDRCRNSAPLKQRLQLRFMRRTSALRVKRKGGSIANIRLERCGMA